MATLRPEDQAAIEALQKKYQSATSQAERDALHNQAESIRAGYGYSGGVDGSQYIQTSKPSTPSAPAGSGYTPLGNFYGDRQQDQAFQDKISGYQDIYNNATTQEERDAAHAAAEALRAQYGYSGGIDGSQTILLPQQGGGIGGGGGFSYDSAPTYKDNYSDRIDQMLNDILNRDKFSYDAMNDPLYAQYKDQYQREGERAMQNTLGAVSARTGGLASSWAGTQAQQANQYYSQQLADKIPELYQLAYKMYLDDIDLQVQDLGLLNNASNTAYNRYRDTMSDWRNDRDFAYGQYRDDVADKKWQTEFDYGSYWDNKNFDYQAGRDQVADDHWNTQWEYGVGRDQVDDEWREKEWEYKKQQDAINNALKQQQASKGSSGSGGYSSGSSNAYGGDATSVLEDAIRWAEEHNSDPEVYIKNNWSGTWKNQTAGLNALAQYLAEQDGGTPTENPASSSLSGRANELYQLFYNAKASGVDVPEPQKRDMLTNALKRGEITQMEADRIAELLGY